MTGIGDPRAPEPAAARDREPVRGATVDDPDGALLGRIAAGDLDALTELYDRHRAMAYAIALRITASVPAAEDVLQDAFLGVWRHASRFDRSRGNGRAWLLSIVHHRAIDHVRRRRDRVELPDPEAPPPAALIAPDVWPEISGRLDATAVRRALGALPDVQREAIELAYWGGLTQAEIAERTATPLGTVKSRVRLGLLALRRELSTERDPSDGPGDAIAAGAATGPSAAEGPTDRSGRLAFVGLWLGSLWHALGIGRPRRLGLASAPASVELGGDAR